MMFTKNIAALAALTFAGVATAFNGDATWFNTGLGSCGVFNQDTDFIVALSTAEAASNSHCGQRINVFFQGRTVNVGVADTCPGCAQFDIDLSPAAFQQLASLDVGRIQVDWEWA